MPFYPIKKAAAIFAYRSKIEKYKPIWLYTDSPGVIDNSYYQFIHDFDKKDGIERYYVVDGDTSYLDDKFTKEQKSRIVKYGSKEHKLLFLNADKIFISFSSFSIYSPFKNLSWYMDLVHYDLIYLQHGLLHASLQKMYGKEYTEFDKFIISSEFEKNNLIENYDYKESDFIMSGMPRMGIKQEQVEVKNKILFAPSWRSYLIGPLKDNRRELKDKEFINSAFFNKINTFLHSQELQDLLEKYDLEFDFKLHPIFKEYRHHFDIDDVNRVDINFDKTILEEYKLFITDFSSFQFDFVQLNRPIVYFMPDKKEFDAGLHSYRELDLKHEDAFGKLCLDSQDLLDELKKIVENDFNIEEPYASRMQNFFTIAEDPCEKIYQSLMGE